MVERAASAAKSCEVSGCCPARLQSTRSISGFVGIIPSPSPSLSLSPGCPYTPLHTHRRLVSHTDAIVTATDCRDDCCNRCSNVSRTYTERRTDLMTLIFDLLAVFDLQTNKVISELHATRHTGYWSLVRRVAA